MRSGSEVEDHTQQVEEVRTPTKSIGPKRTKKKMKLDIIAERSHVRKRSRTRNALSK